MAQLSRRFCLCHLCNSKSAPATPRSKLPGLGYIRFRSPLLTESRLISFPPGTEMFQFPGFAPNGLCIQPLVTPSGCPVTPGFPIRRSPDQSLFDSSPRHIAAYHVLPRFSTPRHPPCTLNSLTTIMRGCRRSFGSVQHLCQADFQRLRFIFEVMHPKRPEKAPVRYMSR